MQATAMVRPELSTRRNIMPIRILPKALTRAVPVVVLAAALATPIVVSAQAADSKVIAADVAAGEVQADLKVESKDSVRRLLTVRDKKGRLHDMYVSEDVKAFDKVKKGDQIVVNYKLAVAIAVKKGGKGERELAQATASAPLSNYETGRSVSRRTTITAAVEEYDADKGIATLRGPKGRVVDVKVEDPEVAKQLKKGDQVVAVVSETLAVALWPKEQAEPARKAMAK
jgi:hypothetical protein